MTVLTFDFETESHVKGNPFNVDNFPIVFAYKYKGKPAGAIYNNGDVVSFTNQVRFIIDEAKYLVGFNLKFDIHWLRWLGIELKDDHILLDGQQLEFLLTNQSTPYPSLEDCAQKYLGESKLDVVKTEYWDKGLLTSEVPQAILEEYAKKDVELTERVVEAQLAVLRTQGKFRLFRLLMEDLKVLQEMEWNGLVFNEDRAIKLGAEARARIAEIDDEIFGNHPYRSFINPNSGDHLSVFLYGGSIIHKEHVPNGVFKSGEKLGQVRYKIIRYELKFKQQFEPIKGSELKKKGFYSTDEKVLRSLKGNKRLIQLILERSELDKLAGTYYEGLIKIRNKMGWIKDELHGQLNTVVARTGRLSASEPKYYWAV